MSESDRQRLFFALWPGGAEREKLESYRPLLRGCGGRPIKPQNLHITLAFLGSVDSAVRECLEQAASAIELPPFTLRLDRLGFWRRPQVIWLGQEPSPEPLLALAGELKQAILTCGMEPDSRGFRTHLTLQRRAHRPPRQREVPPLEWQVDRFVLVASETRPEGVVYEVVREWRLGSRFKV